MQVGCKILAVVNVVNDLKLASITRSKLCYGYKLHLCYKAERMKCINQRRKKGEQDVQIRFYVNIIISPSEMR